MTVHASSNSFYPPWITHRCLHWNESSTIATRWLLLQRRLRTEALEQDNVSATQSRHDCCVSFHKPVVATAIDFFVSPHHRRATPFVSSLVNFHTIYGNTLQASYAIASVRSTKTVTLIGLNRVLRKVSRSLLKVSLSINSRLNQVKLSLRCNSTVIEHISIDKA